MTLASARRLRRDSTEAERRLWRHLRGRNLARYKFRRQHPIGPYIADFCCERNHLVIELDGGHHALQLEQDAERTAYLNSQGYRVVRFWNSDVLSNIDTILELILLALRGGEIPSPYPSPGGRGDVAASNSRADRAAIETFVRGIVAAIAAARDQGAATHAEIAAALNRRGMTSRKGRAWTGVMVAKFLASPGARRHGASGVPPGAKPR